ncbi:hypothetical protein [Coleofasciculus sp. FACHB-1120]|uniref:hypothetical protein n=1 Tax=Cyanophyceae TaxID=3028117 RepID=UPI0016849D70|nr:hypothetical protein [Coleofasciculus sp. FACHB-1120]MBD2743943.1 hypothetical protein [Coleofasciculus sp. FACHB-1120]
MTSLNNLKSGVLVLMALGTFAGSVGAVPINVPVPTVPRASNPSQTKTVISSGASIPVRYDGTAEKILLSRTEKVPLTLTVSSTVKSSYGTTLIPAGTKILGQLEPAGQGSRFVATQIVLPLDGTRTINATSQIVTRTEQIKKGSRTNTILKGAALGGAAASAIAALVGDKAIATEEVLGGSGLGALAGLFWGRKSVDVISVNPSLDLRTITLASQLPVTVALR